MKIKKVIITVAVVAVLGGAAIGGVYAYKSYQQNQLVAEVQQVGNISWGYWGDSATSYGMVTNDSSQEIYLADSKTVKKVYVEEGDTVEVGDPLLEYDTAELRIEIERKKLELSNIQNDIAIANHALETLKVTKPVDKTPPFLDADIQHKYEEITAVQNSIPEKDVNDSRIYNYITETSLPYNAADNPKGTKDDPYIFYCNKDAYVYGSFFNSIRATENGGDGKYAVFYVCQKDSSGKMVFATVPVSGDNAGTPGDTQDTESTEAVEDTENAQNGRAAVRSSSQPVLDGSVSPNTVSFDGNNMPIVYDSERMWYIFTGEEYVPDSAADNYLDDFFNSAIEWEEPVGYTKEELAQAIWEKEMEIKTLDIQRRQQELQLASMQSTASDGMVYAEVAGVVKTAGDPDEYQNDGTAFLVVSGDEGLYVSGTISELLLGDVTVGTVVSANSWESGMTFDATITEISDYPVNNNGWGDGNPNASYYAYTAYIEDSSGLRNGEYLDLTISTNQSETGGLYIEKAYVRQEDGKSYCMIADENDQLKKQYVVTGKTIYGSAVEIKSGLTEEDRIAFPYGKNAVEGAAVEESSNMYW